MISQFRPVHAAIEQFDFHFFFKFLDRKTYGRLRFMQLSGGAPAVASVLARDTLATFTGGPSSAPHVKAGTLRVLAGSGTRRALIMPEVPIVAETYPGYEGVVWSATWAPAGTPEPIVGRLHSEINAILATSEIRDLFRKSGGSEPFISTPAEFREVLRRDTEKYLKIITSLKLSAED